MKQKTLRFNIYIGKEQIKIVENLFKEAKKKRQNTITFKNFKQLCMCLKIKETTNSNSKDTLIKELKESFDIRQQKGKLSYRIFKIYKKPYPRMLNEVFKVKKEDYHKAGVYRISHSDGRAYIGSTNSFRKRFSSHSTEGIYGQEKTYKIIKEGGCFEILQIVDLHQNTIQDLRSIEAMYIEEYLNNKKINCVNEKQSFKNNKINFKKIQRSNKKFQVRKSNLISKEQQIKICELLVDNLKNADLNLTKRQYDYIVNILGGQASE